MFADKELAQQLERAEGFACSAFAEARLRTFPESGACWVDIEGTRCVFDGPSSPATQTFGLGMEQPVTAAALDEMEQFFFRRGANVYHEVSPLADPSALAVLNERRYRPFEFTTVLVQELTERAATKNVTCPVREAEPEDLPHWAALFARGWDQYSELAGFFDQLAEMSANREDTVCFYADVEGRPAAAGCLSIQNDVALLSGASTLPEVRGRGAQQSLLAYRLRYAIGRGCRLAMIGSLPGSASQRNAERNGFRVAYSRLKWELQLLS